MNRFFRRFCINLFGMDHLHYYSSHSDFRERGVREDKVEDGGEEIFFDVLNSLLNLAQFKFSLRC
jgi:hypothetical protein